MLRPEHRVWTRRVAVFTAFLELLISLAMLPEFDATAALQWEEKLSWIPSLGANYYVAVDGISMAFVLLTTLLTFLCLCYSTFTVTHREREYYAWFLLLESGTIATFISFDLLLFFFAFETVLVPMYFLVAMWGGGQSKASGGADTEKANYAAIKFLIYTLAGSLALLLGIIGLHHAHYLATGVRTFNLVDFLAFTGHHDWEPLLFWSFFLGFAVKTPMVPFHTWLPDAHTEAPTAGSVMLAGLLLKMGTYGLIRFVWPLFPATAQDPQVLQIVSTLSVLGILYGGLVCLMQKDWKKLIAYSSVSHMGFVTLSLCTHNRQGLTGSLIEQVNHAIATGLLFFVVGFAYDRAHTREIAAFQGLGSMMPRFSAVFLVAILSSMGMPPLNGFVGEVTMLGGAQKSWTWWAVAMGAGILLGGAYLLWLYQRVVMGQPNRTGPRWPDLSWKEAAVAAPLLVLIFWIGLSPAWLFRWFEKPVSLLLARHP